MIYFHPQLIVTKLYNIKQVLGTRSYTSPSPDEFMSSSSLMSLVTFLSPLSSPHHFGGVKKTIWCKARFRWIALRSIQTEHPATSVNSNPNSAFDVLQLKVRMIPICQKSEISWLWKNSTKTPRTRDRLSAMSPKHCGVAQSRLFGLRVVYRVIIGGPTRRRLRARCARLTMVNTRTPSASFPDSKCNKIMTSRQNSCRGR